MPLITREQKGSKLTISEMDNNFTYLEDLAISNATSSNGVSSDWLNPNDNTWHIRTYSGGTAVSFNGSDPVTWWDADLYSDKPNDAGFRGAIVNYHGYSNNQTTVGTIIIACDYGGGSLSHHEAVSHNPGQPNTYWCSDGGESVLQFTASQATTVLVQFTSTMFYGSEFYC